MKAGWGQKYPKNLTTWFIDDPYVVQDDTLDSQIFRF